MGESELLTCGGRSATPAYAIPWGMTVSPTVIPAIRSETPVSKVYFGSQDTMGTLRRRFLREHREAPQPKKMTGYYYTLKRTKDSMYNHTCERIFSRGGGFFA